MHIENMSRGPRLLHVTSQIARIFVVTASEKPPVKVITGRAPSMAEHSERTDYTFAIEITLCQVHRHPYAAPLLCVLGRHGCGDLPHVDGTLPTIHITHAACPCPAEKYLTLQMPRCMPHREVLRFIQCLLIIGDVLRVGEGGPEQDHFRLRLEGSLSV